MTKNTITAGWTKIPVFKVTYSKLRGYIKKARPNASRYLKGPRRLIEAVDIRPKYQWPAYGRRAYPSLFAF